MIYEAIRTETCADQYEDAVHLYISMIKQDSLEAGEAVEQIHIRFGLRAALRATLVIRLLKMVVKEKYPISDPSLYDGITQNYPEVLPLLDEAILCCCQAWDVSDATVLYPHHP